MNEPERSAPSRDVPIARQVINVIADRMAIDPDGVKETFTFSGDLRADSLDVAELVMDFEDAFGLPRHWETELPNSPVATTVGDVIAYITRKREPENVQKMLEHTKAEVAKGLQSPSQLITEAKLDYDAARIKEVALDLAGEFWWHEGIKQLKLRGLNHHSGNETSDRATTRAMLSYVYDLFRLKPNINEVTDAAILLELFKRKHLLERLTNEVFNRSK